MTIEWSQISAIGVIAAAVAVCIALVLGLVGLLRRIWKWVAGGRETPVTPSVGPKPEAISLDSAVTASDIFAVRSNLNAVSRQLEDLENKLRLNPPRH